MWSKTQNPLVDSSYQMTLADGRKLGYHIKGNLENKPLFYFHGFPGSRVEGTMFFSTVQRSGFYIISIDRPGIGLSSSDPSRTLISWVADFQALVFHLGLETYAIAAMSGGVPYALACARFCNPRALTRIILASGMGPCMFHSIGLNFWLKRGLTLVARWPPLVYCVFQYLVRPFFFPAEINKISSFIYANFVPSVDRNCFLAASIRHLYYLNNLKAFQSGIEGMVRDLENYSHSWGFSLEAIPQSHRIIILHGNNDSTIRFQMSVAVASRLSGAQLHLFPNEGHFSTIFHHLHVYLST